jgi:galactonate dehydratase
MNERPSADTAFVISAVDAFHFVARDTYWRGQRAGNRVEAGRFVLKPGWRTVYATRVETALVRVTLADGTVGWGEATEPICPEVVCRLAVALLAPVLGGRDFHSPEDLWEAGYDLNRGRGHLAGYHLLSLAALEVAVWDALGRRAGLPVATLLAGNPAQNLSAYLSGLRRASLAERVTLARQVVDEGWAGAKIFVDADTEATLAEVDALRAGVPGHWRLMADALWSYECVEEAAVARAALSQRDVAWLECPLPPEDLDAHVALAGGSGTPVALGEHFFTARQSIPWFEAGALHVFQPDICRTGLSDGMRQAAAARARGIAVTPHMGSGSPVLQAAALQFASAARSDLPVEFQRDLAALGNGAFRSAWMLEHGTFTLADAPGLGVDVDPEKVAAMSTREKWTAG